MDVNSLFSHGGILVKNPNYSHNNGQPEYIHNTDISKIGNSLASAVSYAASNKLQYQIGDENINETLRKRGVTPTAYNTDSKRVDKTLYDSQSGISMIMNSIVQSIGSELVLGTLKSLGELVDFIGAAANSDRSIYDESGYVKRLNNAQEALKEKFKIETLDDVTLGHGALTNMGWYTSNLPTVMSTVTLLIPARAATSVGKLGIKGLKLVKAGIVENNVGNLTTYSKNISKILSKLKLDPVTKTNLGTYTGVISDAAFQRTIENYQEAKQVNDDQIKDFMDYFASSPNAFEEWKENNPEFIESLKGRNIDINSKQQVAKEIARQSANKTFLTDYWNIGFDIFQIGMLKNKRLFKGIKPKDATIATAQRRSIENPLVELKDVKGIEKRSFKKLVNDYKTEIGAFLGESTEGVEEAVNYIAQQEGMTYGKVLAGLKEDTDVTQRLNDYIKSPQLWDSFFWGVAGGIGFRFVGSGLNRVKLGVDARKNDKKNNVELKSWKDYFSTGEDQIRTASINNRVAKLRELEQRLELIEQGRDPYVKDNPIIENKAEIPYYKNRILTDYINDLTIAEINAGNYELLQDYLNNPNVREVIKNEIMNKDEDADKYLDDITKQMTKVSSLYNKELDRLAKMSKFIKGDVPIEYLQNIATTNVQSKLIKDNINDAKGIYNTEVKNLSDELDNNQQFTNLNFETYVRLQVLSDDLGRSYAQLKSLRLNEKELNSINGKRIEEKLKKKISDIITRINRLQGIESLQNVKGYNQTAVNLWSLIDATKFELIDKNIIENNTTDDYLDLKDKISKKEYDEVNKLLKKYYGEFIPNIDFSDVLKSDEGQNNSIYDILGSTVGEMKEFSKHHLALQETYKTLEFLNLEEDLADQDIIEDNEEELSYRLRYLDESAKEIVDKGQIYALDQLKNLVDKYGDDTLENFIFNGIDIENITPEDKKMLDDAIAFLDLTNKTEGFYNKIKNTLYTQRVANELNKSLEEATKKRNSDEIPSTSKKLVESPEKSKTIQSSQKGTKSNRRKKNGVSDKIYNINDRKIKLKITQNGLKAEDTDSNDNDVFRAIKRENDENYNLVAINKDVDLGTLQNDELFNDPRKNDTTNENKPYIENNPIINIDDNNNITVIQKGSLSYQSSFTGEDEKPKIKEEKEISKSSDTHDEDYMGGFRPDKNESLLDEIRAKINDIYKKGFNEKSIKNIDEFLENAKQEILKEYSNLDPNTINDISNVLDVSIRTQKRRYNRSTKMDAAIDDVLSSSIKEIFDSNNSKLVNAIEDLIQAHIKENLHNRHFEKDGKPVYILNAFELYKTIYNEYESKELVTSIYNLVNDYLSSKQNDAYILTDENIDDPNLLDKVFNQDIKSLIQEGQNNLQTLNLNIELTPEEKVENLNALKTITKGTPLTAKVETRVKNNKPYKTLVIRKGNSIIGNMALPDVDETTGYFTKVNNKWKYDLSNNNNIAIGKIVDGINHLFLDDEIRAKELFDYLTIYKYDDNLSNADRNNIVKKVTKIIYDSGIDKSLLFGYTKEEKQMLDKNENPDAERVEHLSNLVGYLSSGLDYNTVKEFIPESLNNWFNKLYNSYLTADNLRKNPDNYNITLDNYYGGQLVTLKNKEDRVQSQKAIADISNAKLTIVYVDPIDKKTYRLLDDGTKEETTVAKAGTMSVVIYDRMKNPFSVYANSVRLNDKKIDKNSDAAEVIKAIRNELNSRINKLSNLIVEDFDTFDDSLKENINKAYNELKDFVEKLFYNSYKNPIKLEEYRDVINSPLLAGGFYGLRDESHDFYFTQDKFRDDKTKLGLSFGHNSFEILENNEWSEYSYEDSTIKLIEYANRILDYTMFNIDYKKLSPGIIDNNGLLKVNQDGVKIIIPSIDGTTLIKSYPIVKNNSFTNAILKGGFIKVNTKIDENTNTNFGINQDKMDKQSITIKIESKNESNTPIKEERNIKEVTDYDKATSILTSNSKTKVDDLVKLSNYKNRLAGLRKYNLLPSDIVIEKGPNDGKLHYAGIHPDSKQIYVTQDWINLFNNEDDRDESIRKLIHEQLHYIFLQDNNKEYIKKLEGVYEEFKEYVNSHKDDSRYKIGKYYLDQLDKKSAKVEEFIVESLTSIPFYDYLNNAIIEDKVNTKNKESIFAKILNYLKKIFGWDINKNSIFAKEIGLLSEKLETEDKVEDKIQNDEENLSIVDLGDDFESSISEKIYPTVNDYIKTANDEDRTFITNKLNNGDLSIICKI